MRIHRASGRPSTRRGMMPWSFFIPSRMPSWIALTWRSVLPVEMTKWSV